MADLENIIIVSYNVIVNYIPQQSLQIECPLKLNMLQKKD